MLEMTKQQFEDMLGKQMAPLVEKLEHLQKENDVLKLKHEELDKELDKVDRTFSGGLVGVTHVDGKTFVGPHLDPLNGKGLAAARFIRMLLQAKGNSAQALTIAKDGKDDMMVKYFEKVQTVTDFTAGGATVPEQLVADLIGVLESRAVVRQAGPQRLGMPSGALSMPKITADATASYAGESVPVDPTSIGTGNLKLNAKKLVANIPVSNDLLRQSSPSADIWIRDRLVRSLVRREDQAFLRGTGASDTPKGLRFLAATANVFTRQATPDLAKISQDLIKAIWLLEDSDVEMLRPAWFMRPKVKWGIRGLRDGNGNQVFEAQMSNGVLYGIPFFDTTHIPNNIGSGGTKSEVILADMASMILADTLNLSVAIFDGGTWESGGTVYSGVARDATVLRAISEHDFGAEHEEAISVIEDIDWETA